MGVAAGTFDQLVRATDWRSCTALAQFDSSVYLEASKPIGEAGDLLDAAELSAVHE